MIFLTETDCTGYGNCEKFEVERFTYLFYRFGLHWRVDVQNRVIPEGYAIFDLPGFFIQIGIDLYERMNDPKYLIKWK